MPNALIGALGNRQNKSGAVLYSRYVWMWNLLSGMLEWSWVVMHGIARQV
ncbi:hypothetical protein HanIR_Chr12g0614661 [Helianthus annuus]|nr:hypothetical protein HanIR_Chr12g0614661 [Helianthus annuus]